LHGPVKRYILITRHFFAIIQRNHHGTIKICARFVLYGDRSLSFRTRSGLRVWSKYYFTIIGSVAIFNDASRRRSRPIHKMHEFTLVMTHDESGVLNCSFTKARRGCAPIAHSFLRQGQGTLIASISAYINERIRKQRIIRPNWSLYSISHAGRLATSERLLKSRMLMLTATAQFLADSPAGRSLKCDWTDTDLKFSSFSFQKYSFMFTRCFPVYCALYFDLSCQVLCWIK